jgi:hypothetical protein
MKKIFFYLLTLFFTASVFAQQVPDQNPNYELSRSKYMAAKDSLLGTQSTTVQNTYKAYDWMQLRQERKDIRFQNRQQRRLNRSLGYNNYWGYNDVYPYGSYNFNYYRNGYYNPYRFYNNNFRFSDIWLWLLF